MFISPTQSNIIKAIAILLIILGHNHILAPQSNSSLLFEFLYKFHVSIFFILPFFYNKKNELNKENIYKVISRNGIPYLLFFAFCYFVYHFIFIKDGFNLLEFFGGIINAPGYNAKNTTGFVFLWFLPVFLLMSLYRLIGNRYHRIALSFFLIGFIICINKQAYNFMWHSPFYILKALYYYAMGLSTYILYKYIKYMNYIGTIAFIVLTFLYWTDYHQINTFYFSIAGFCALREITTLIDFSKIFLLRVIGEYSLSIYLIHVFIYNVLEKLLPNTIIGGIIIYGLTVSISLLVSIGIYRINILRSFLFPKSWKEWIKVFSTSKTSNSKALFK